MNTHFPGARLLLLMLTLGLALGSILPAAGQGDSPEATALQDLLRFVPDAPEIRAYLAYGDVAAWHESWGIERPDSQAALEQMDRVDRAYWLQILYRQTAPPDSLGVLYLGRDADHQRDFYGFNFFDVDRFLAAGQPPHWITVLDLGVESEAVAAALLDSGYTETPLAGDDSPDAGTLYSFRDDYEIDVTFHIRSGMFPHMNRIALLDEQIVTGPATALVTAAVDSAVGEAPTLADDPAYQAAVAALTSGAASAEAGLLVGAIFIDGAEFADLASDPRVAAYLAEVEPLPAFSLAAFGTRHTEGMTSLILAVVLPPGSDAAAAAENLGRRLRRYRSLSLDAPLAEVWRVETVAGRAYGGLPVALLVMRIDDPPPTPDDQPFVNASVLPWVELIASRDVGFLAFDTE